MRRFLLPILLVTVGLGLILTYLILRSSSTEPGLFSLETLESPVASRNQPSIITPQNPTPVLTEEPVEAVSPTSQPIFPTRTPDPILLETPDVIETTGTKPVENIPNSLQIEVCPLPDCRSRVGVSGRMEIVSAAYESGLPFGQYLNWWSEANPPEPDGVNFWQMVSISAAGPSLSWTELGEIVDARPGSIWIVGNEPDIIWQDNTPAERYAQIYHEVYTFIKEHDPEARLAIAGVGQPSPLRMAYLDIVLDSYLQSYGVPLPVDIWTVHAFILREQRDSWGVGIPPGMDVEEGILYELKDHNNLVHFQQNLVNFRAWMAERGYGDRPLAVTEYGILHPEEYGFPPEIVADFLIGAFDFFATATNESGYLADNNRLVQWWFWYSVFDGEDFPTGNLYDPQVGQLTTLGEVFTSLLNDEDN